MIVPLEPETVDVGKHLRLKCDVRSSPKAKIQWFSPQQAVVSQGDTLVLQAITPSDAGVYTCRATVQFSDGQQASESMPVKVFVRCQSKFSHNSSFSFFKSL